MDKKFQSGGIPNGLQANFLFVDDLKSEIAYDKRKGEININEEVLKKRLSDTNCVVIGGMVLSKDFFDKKQK